MEGKIRAIPKHEQIRCGQPNLTANTGQTLGTRLEFQADQFVAMLPQSCAQWAGRQMQGLPEQDFFCNHLNENRASSGQPMVVRASEDLVRDRPRPRSSARSDFA